MDILPAYSEVEHKHRLMKRRVTYQIVNGQWLDTVNVRAEAEADMTTATRADSIFMMFERGLNYMRISDSIL